MTPKTIETSHSPAVDPSSACFASSDLEKIQEWLMTKKHEYQVEQGMWRTGGSGGMTARAEGKTAAIQEVLKQVRAMISSQNANSAGDPPTND